jgi:peroxiredoxin
MKKALISITGIVSLLVLLGFIFKDTLIQTIYGALTQDMFISEDTDSFDPGSEIGQKFPLIDATFDGKQISSIKSFHGEKGTIFVVSRSLDWCPYCMKQMAEINDKLEQFQSAGINVVGLTYDPPEKQQPFKDKFNIAYPIFSDNNAASVKQLGILNTDYEPGDDAYGIGHPGAFILNSEGEIVAKIFVEAYSLRVDALSLMEYAKQALE